MITLFYRSFIESLFSFCIVTWHKTLTLSNKNKLATLVKVAVKIIGEEQTCPTDKCICMFWERPKPWASDVASDVAPRSSL